MNPDGIRKGKIMKAAVKVKNLTKSFGKEKANSDFDTAFKNWWLLFCSNFSINSLIFIKHSLGLKVFVQATAFLLIQVICCFSLKKYFLVFS